jgi:hydrogenase expression/formation protein HypE
MALECPIPIQDYDAVTLAHGGGGKLTNRLIERLFVPALDNPYLRELQDGAVLDWAFNRLAYSTDSYVVHPQFFPGGNIGLLAVHGTVNDLAMCGARPRYLSLAFIIEEGFLLKQLWEIVSSIRQACDAGDLQVVTGDTKVVERGNGDGLFINTTGIGELHPAAEVAPRRIRPGDSIVLNGPIAEHGMAILSVREGLEFESDLQSDTAPLWTPVERMLDSVGGELHALRDATRGGIASVTNELAAAANVGIVIDESAIPVREDVKGACELLGFDPLYVANEGRMLAFVAPEAERRVLESLRDDPLGRQAVVVGQVVAEHPGVVRLKSRFGGSRVLDMMSGEQLPRIC